MKSLGFLHKIKLIYDIVFVVLSIIDLSVFVNYLKTNAEFSVFAVLFIGWISSFAVLILLNIVDLLTRKVFIMERQLQEQHLLPPNDTENGKN